MTSFKVFHPQLCTAKFSKTEYAVTMECQECIDSISKILSRIPGINTFQISLENQSVLIDGTVAPSKITRALRETGRAAILRGSGESEDGLGFDPLKL
jgi:copper chaperone for superoxide dismutase